MRPHVLPARIPIAWIALTAGAFVALNIGFAQILSQI
jgi:hypothetical protein